MRSLRTILSLLLLMPAALAGPALAQREAAAAAQRPALTAADIDRLTNLLQDEGRRAEFLRTLEALAAASRAQAGTAAEGSVPVVAAPAMAAVSPAAESAEAPPPAAAPRQGAQAQPSARPPAAPQPAPAPAAQPAPSQPALGQPVAAQPVAAQPASGQPAPPAQPSAQPSATPAPPAPAEEPLIAPNTVGAQLLLSLRDRIGQVSEALLQGIRAMADLPGLWEAVAGMARDPIARARLLDAAWKLLLLIGLGLALEWAVWRALAGTRRQLDAMAPADGSAWSWMRRVPLVFARLLLDLAPITGFALAVYGLIGFVRPLPTTQLAALLAAHVYVGARCAFVLARILLSPASRHLRLVPLSDQAAWYCVVWLRRMLLVGLGGYVLAEVGVSLGLSWAAYDTIVNLTLLVMSLMLVRIILQQRHAVAATLAAPPLGPEEQPDRSRRLLRAARTRLAEVWHILAILWLLALWAVSALAVENGFERLLRASAATLLILGLAKGLDELLRRILDQALQPGAETARRWPGLQARAASYGPVLRAVVSVAIALGGLVLLLESWGIEATAWFAEGTLGSRLLGTLFSIGATLVLAVAVWEAANLAIQRRLTRLARDAQAARSARVRTLLPMLRTFLGVVILVFVVLNSLAQLGVNVAPLLAGAGVVGLAVGFGSQTLVRDVITGIFLLLEDAVAVGDVVTLAGLSGVVENLSIRSIRLRALDGSVHIIPFSAVTTVTNMTRDFSFAVLDLTVGYGEDTDRVAEVLREISQEMRAEPKWQGVMRDDIEVMGVERFADSGVTIRARVKTEPAARWNVLRELNRRIKRRFDELGIEIPYPHQKLVVGAPDLRYPPQPRAAQ